MVTITLYVRQQKRHRYIEQSFGLCGRGRGWDDLGEWHWNMYNIICETNHQSRFDAWFRMLRAGALGWPRGMGWGERWEGGSGWGTRVNPWQIHVDVRQNQYNIVKEKKINKINSCKRKKIWKNSILIKEKLKSREKQKTTKQFSEFHYVNNVCNILGMNYSLIYGV